MSPSHCGSISSPSLSPSARKERGQKDLGYFPFLAGQEVSALSMQRRPWELLARSYFVELVTGNRKLSQTCSDPDLVLTKPLSFPSGAQKMMGLFFSL